VKNLLDKKSLDKSSIVANSSMNRERVCFGGNSYEKELYFKIVEFLIDRTKTQKQVTWLDICCGQGKALIEASTFLAEQTLASNIKIIGIDLVGMFQEFSPELDFLKLIETSFEDFKPNCKFDLLTCVHGLHYIGDKLKFIQNCASWLKPDGIFLTNLDLANFKVQNGKPANKIIAKTFRNIGLEYNSKKHLLICKGKKEFEFSFEYLGANDKAGANYTKQAVVDSFYLC
jgi:SAM-dependent methyltransferase